MAIKYSKQLHTRPAGKIIYAYCDVLIFAFYGGLPWAYVRYCKAAADAAAARSRLIPVELLGFVLVAEDGFETEQRVWRRCAM
jgi:hypothetical protein